jgi:hypothetical protein
MLDAAARLAGEPRPAGRSPNWPWVWAVSPGNGVTDDAWFTGLHDELRATHVQVAME